MANSRFCYAAENSLMPLDTQQHSYDREHEKYKETGDEEHLSDEHRLRALAGLAFQVGQLPAAQADRARGEGLAHLGPVLGDQAERRGQVAQLVDADLLT